VSETAEGLLQTLYGADPYQGFSADAHPLDLHGGLDHPALTEIIRRLRPRIVFEVGSWKGANAIRMAKLLKELGVDGAVVCIDTWLGSVEHWNGGTSPEWDIRPMLKHGYPTLYYQFLANVVHAGVQDIVVPVPNTSDNAAKWLAGRVTADLIYVDASHEEEDVYRDVCNYWQLLRPGGVLCGDDWHAYWHGVICGVNRFVKENGLNLRISGPMWSTEKPVPHPSRT